MATEEIRSMRGRGKQERDGKSRRHSKKKVKETKEDIEGKGQSNERERARKSAVRERTGSYDLLGDGNTQLTHL